MEFEFSFPLMFADRLIANTDCRAELSTDIDCDGNASYLVESIEMMDYNGDWFGLSGEQFECVRRHMDHFHRYRIYDMIHSSERDVIRSPKNDWSIYA